MEFIVKYDSKGKSNYCLSEEHLIKKCSDKYDQMMEDENTIDKFPSVDLLRLEEIKRIKNKTGKKKRKKG